ncbi:MAG: hypothetical protein AABY22_15000 [Nanoarchaeota archaeon]
MKLTWIDILLILLGLFIAYQIIKAIFGGTWEIEDIILALLIFNLGLTWKLNMDFHGHIAWHKVKDK